MNLLRKIRAARLCILFISCGLLEGKPLQNVIFILVDDWGWTDGGVLGSDYYETPHIDRLAAEGVRFTQAYAACTVCSPTRAAILTGLNPARLRVTDWIGGHSRHYTNPPLLEPDWTRRLEHSRTTIAEVLRKEGYRTASIGKWHLTPDGEPGSAEVSAYWPEHHGFEVNVGGNRYGGPGSYFAPFSGPDRSMANMPPAEEGDFLTDRLTDEAIRVIEKWRNERFFIYLPFYAIHTPIQGKPELVAKYLRKLRPGLRHTQPEYAALVESTDHAIGRILAALERFGLDSQTLIILTGDNGGLDRGDAGRFTDNFPLRNGKGSVYEGGIRVPLIFRLPGCVPGKIVDFPVISMDFFPTILEILGIDEPDLDFDGISLRPLLTDNRDTLSPRDLFWHYPHYHVEGATPYSAVRSGNFRLIEYHLDGNVELYNLSEDPGERMELSRRLPHVTFRLRNRLNEWRSSVSAQMPTPNPHYTIAKPTRREW